jgi:hypothetical protein
VADAAYPLLRHPPPTTTTTTTTQGPTKPAVKQVSTSHALASTPNLSCGQSLTIHEAVDTDRCQWPD